ncbi:MAG: hypothetical protein A4E57_04566 [Syntrophorhabdaceae bacterium PtaU1.Bin034]|nr:MAG: hypothetical protein A4E57_04566 [Syntrophorhabdaceae bacterium PtaU1.Bin034]
MQAPRLKGAHIAPCAYLRGADMVVDVCSPRIFDTLFRGRDARPRLACTRDLLNPDAFRVYPYLAGSVRHAEHIGRGGHEAVALQLLHLHDPGFRIEDAAGHDLAAYLLRSIMACPEGHEDVVPERNEDAVRVPVALGMEDIGPALGPPFPILPGVRLIHGRACCPARLAELRHLRERDCKHVAVRERLPALDIPEHAFVCFRNFSDILHGIDVARLHTCILVKSAVKRRVVVRPFENPLELLHLKVPELLPGQRLQQRVPVETWVFCHEHSSSP